MADSADRGRRKKKRIVKLREKESTPVTPGKTLVILSKPSSENVPSETGIASTSTESSKPVTKSSKPTVILKSRDLETSHRESPPVSRDQNEVPTPLSYSPSHGSSHTQNYQIAQSKHSHSTAEGFIENKIGSSIQMKNAVKLIDENMQWVENSLEFLTDQTDFYVIGVVGMQGAGKSSIMSLLGNGRLDISHRSHVFRTQSRDAREIGEHCTCGIDIYVSNNRVILLDMQPVFSASVLEQLLDGDKRYSSDFGSIFQTAEIQSLQLVSFLFTVCHTVIAVQDWFTDPNFLRFLQTAEMLKPAMPTQSNIDINQEENEVDYFPHIVFVLNKCTNSDFAARKITEMQNVLSTVFFKSKLKYKGSVSMRNDQLIPASGPDENNVNLFLIPEKLRTKSRVADEGMPEYKSHPSWEILAQSLFKQIYSMPRSNLTRLSITEKNWFHYAAKSWEGIKKSNLFLEYSRVMP